MRRASSFILQLISKFELMAIKNSALKTFTRWWQTPTVKLLFALGALADPANAFNKVDVEKEIVSQLDESMFTASSYQSGFYPYRARTKNPYNTFVTETTDTQNQWWRVDLTNEGTISGVQIQGVLILVDQDNMTGGDFEVFTYSGEPEIDFSEGSTDWRRYYKCNPETINGVGTNAQGGAFNCTPRWVKLVMIRCVTSCTPNLALSTVRIWGMSILSADATVYLTSSQCVVLSPYSEADFPTLVKESSFWGVKDSSSHALTIRNDSSTVLEVSISVEFQRPAKVRSVYIASFNINGLFGAVTDEPIDILNRVWLDNISSNIWSQSITYSEVYKVEELTGKHFTLARGNDKKEIWLDKLVVAGTYCEEVSLDFEIYPIYPCIELQYSGFIQTIAAPVIDFGCAQNFPESYPDYNEDVQWEFYWYGTSDISDIVTYYPETNEFKIAAYDTYFVDRYPDQPVVLRLSNKVVPDWMPDRAIYGPTLEVILNNRINEVGSICGQDFSQYIVDDGATEENKCETGSLIAPNAIDQIEVEVGALEPLIFTFPEVKDTGSIEMGDSTGLSSCGPREYTLQDLKPFIEQEERNLFIQSINQGDAGLHQVKMEVLLKDYSQVAPLEVVISIKILPCEVTGLIDPYSTLISPFNQIIGLPVVSQLAMPLYEPFPLCGFSDADVSYKLATGTGGALPDWIRINPNLHQIEFEADEDRFDLLGKEFSFKLTASFQNSFKQTQTFKIIFLEPEPEEFIEQEENKPEPEPSKPKVPSGASQDDQADDDEAEEEVDTQSPSEINSWDGWKILLSQLGLDFDLPKPRYDDPSYVPQNPKVTIGKITAEGKSTIKFSKPMFPLENMTSRKIAKGRRLTNQVAFLDIKLVPGENSDPELLKFNPVTTWVNDQTIEVELKWATPPAISAQSPEDRLTIGFYGPFFDKIDGLPLKPENVEQEADVPPQLMPGALTAAVAAAGGSLQAGSTGLLAGNAVMNIFLQGSLNQVWGMINNLQIIIHAPLIEVPFPANAFMIYEVMLTVATFEILPSGEILPGIFPNLSEENAFSQKFERLGYDTQYLIMNMGTMFLVFTLNVFFLVIYCPLKALSRCSKIAGLLARKISRFMFFGWPIVFIQEAYLDLLLAVCINMFSLKGTWISWDNNLNNFLTLLILSLLIALPLFILAYICPNYKQLKRSRFMDKYGAIYDMINLRHRELSPLLWCLFFLGRRVAFAVGVIFFVKYPFFQILFFIVPTMAVIAMVGIVKPLPTPFENSQELYNNFSIMVLSYCLLCFTGFVPDPMTRYNIGYAMILLTLQNIVVGLYFVGKQPFHETKLRLKRCLLLRAARKRAGIETPSFFRRLTTKDFYVQKYRSMKSSFFEEDDENDLKQQNVPERKVRVSLIEDKELSVIKEDQDSDEKSDEQINNGPKIILTKKIPSPRAAQSLQDVPQTEEIATVKPEQFSKSVLVKGNIQDLIVEEPVRNNEQPVTTEPKRQTIHIAQPQGGSVYNAADERSRAGTHVHEAQIVVAKEVKNERPTQLPSIEGSSGKASSDSEEKPIPMATLKKKVESKPQVDVKNLSPSAFVRPLISSSDSSFANDSSEPSHSRTVNDSVTSRSQLTNQFRVLIEERIKKSVYFSMTQQPQKSQHQQTNERKQSKEERKTRNQHSLTTNKQQLAIQAYYQDFLTLAKTTAKEPENQRRVSKERQVSSESPSENERHQERTHRKAKTKTEFYQQNAKAITNDRNRKQAATTQRHAEAYNEAQKLEDARHDVKRNNFRVTQMIQDGTTLSEDSDQERNRRKKHQKKDKSRSKRRHGDSSDDEDFKEVKKRHKRSKKERKEKGRQTHIDFKGERIPLPNVEAQGGQLTTRNAKMHRTGIQKAAGKIFTNEGGNRHGAAEPERKRFDVFHSSDEGGDSDYELPKPLDRHEQRLIDKRKRVLEHEQQKTDFLSAVQRIQRMLKKDDKE